MIAIELSKEQEQKFNKWKDTFGELPNIGATGGHFGLKIIFTSIGVVIEGFAWTGESIDLAEF